MYPEIEQLDFGMFGRNELNVQHCIYTESLSSPDLLPLKLALFTAQADVHDILSVVASVILGIEDEGTKGHTARQLTPNFATTNPTLAGTNLQFEIDKAVQVLGIPLLK